MHCAHLNHTLSIATHRCIVSRLKTTLRSMAKAAFYLQQQLFTFNKLFTFMLLTIKIKSEHKFLFSQDLCLFFVCVV